MSSPSADSAKVLWLSRSCNKVAQWIPLVEFVCLIGSRRSGQLDMFSWWPIFRLAYADWARARASALKMYFNHHAKRRETDTTSLEARTRRIPATPHSTTPPLCLASLRTYTTIFPEQQFRQPDLFGQNLPPSAHRSIRIPRSVRCLPGNASLQPLER